MALIASGLLLTSSAALAQKTAVKPSQEWSGSISDAKLKKDAQPVITSEKDLEKLWKAWKLADKMPKVDFEKEIVVVITGDGSKLRLAMSLDQKGNLQVLGLGTRDLAEGFRYVIATVPRKDVKTVNAKDLPK
jgi:hypothetical protein